MDYAQNEEVTIMKMVKKRNNPKMNLAINAMLTIVIIMILIKLGLHFEVISKIKFGFNQFDSKIIYIFMKLEI